MTITNYSLGRTNYIKGGVDYDVQFQADVCMPHPGQKFKAQVKLRSKVGIHCETPPIKILIPRDLHIGNAEFESVKVDEDIEFEVIGAQFKQQDVDIIVVARLLTKVASPVLQPLLAQVEPTPIETQSQQLSGDSEEKRVVITDAQPEKPKRKLRQSAGMNTNELPPATKEGVAQGPN